MADKFPEQEITPIPVSSFPVIIGNVISPVSELCDSDWEMQLPIFEVSFIVIYISTRHTISCQFCIICQIIKCNIC